MVIWGLLERNELTLMSIHGYTTAGVGACLDLCCWCFSWYVVEVYVRMYSIYKRGFYEDYYSGAVIC